MENAPKTSLKRQNRGMAGRQPKTPSYRHHKATGKAVVTLNGRDVYLGRYGSAASREAYDRLIAEWLTAGRTVPDRRTGEGATVVELVVSYIRYAKEYYRRPDGTRTSSYKGIVDAMRPLRKLYGRTPVADFGPLSLQAVRRTMIDGGLSRHTINQRINAIRAAFKWSVGRELADPSVLEGLRAVAGLRAGRSKARETEPIRSVPSDDVNAVFPYVSRQVEAMIRLQLATAARPGEICDMRPVDIDVNGRVWLYRPSVYKTKYRGRERVVYIGPRGQEVLKPFLADRPVDAFLFMGSEAVAERAAEAVTHRRARQKANPRKTDRATGRYTTSSYRRAIARACKAAGVPCWHPHQLRHNAATTLRREYGLEAAALLCGHASAVLTDSVYAERDSGKIIEIIAEAG